MKLVIERKPEQGGLIHGIVIVNDAPELASLEAGGGAALAPGVYPVELRELAGYSEHPRLMPVVVAEKPVAIHWRADVSDGSISLGKYHGCEWVDNDPNQFHRIYLEMHDAHRNGDAITIEIVGPR